MILFRLLMPIGTDLNLNVYKTIGNMNMTYSNGDIVRWNYTDVKIEKMGGYSSLTYWCMSKIAIYSDGRFVDTYWHTSSTNKYFTEEEISQSLEVEEEHSKKVYEVYFVANIADLIECRETEFSYYDQSDCVNISHPNNSRSGFYIRKGAEKSIEKMKRVILAHVKYYEREEASAKREVERLENDLATLTTESYLPCNPDVYI